MPPPSSSSTIIPRVIRRPSPEDVSVTRAIIQAGQLLDVDVLDHLVIGQQHFVSLKERGWAFLVVDDC